MASRWIDPFLTFFTHATDAPQEYGKAAALMALSTLALGRRTVATGSELKPNIYMMLVADSTVARKTTSVVYAKKAVEEIEPNRVGPSDLTMEGLYRWMTMRVANAAGQPTKAVNNRLTLFAEEFGADLSRMAAYSTTMESDLCALYDGGNILKVRAKGKPIQIHQPRVSLFAAAAYEMLVEHLNKHAWHNGFLMRFLFVPAMQMRPTTPAQPPHPSHLWDAAIFGLKVIQHELTQASISLYPDAQAMQLFAQATSTVAQIAAGNHLVSTYVERWKYQVLKLALLFQCDEDATTPHIGVSAMMKALDFGWICYNGFDATFEKTMAGEFGALFVMVEKYLRAAGGPVGKRQIANQFKQAPLTLVKVLAIMEATDLVQSITDPRSGDTLVRWK